MMATESDGLGVDGGIDGLELLGCHLYDALVEGDASGVLASVTDEAQLESLALGVSDGRRHQVGW